MNESLLAFHLFDREAGTSILERRLPHWSQAGAVAFITWRTHDSMPKPVVNRWLHERSVWLLTHGISPTRLDWRERLTELSPALVKQFNETFWNRWHDELDACHGECVLRNPALAQIVANSLMSADKSKYLILDYVIMPNHVHLLAAFEDDEAMLRQCESWKHFTAREINRALRRKGRLWQQDAFDHLVRTEQQFDYLRAYIRDNPQRARLSVGQYLHYSLRLPSGQET